MSKEYGVIALTTAVFLAGCKAASISEPTPTLPPAPTDKPSTETPVPPTLTPVLPTRTLIPVATPTRGIDPKILQGMEGQMTFDQKMKDRIEQAKTGEVLILERVLLGHIIRFPWEGGDAIIATIDTLGSDNKPHLTAVVLSMDCAYDTLRDKNQLGNSTSFIIGRAWTPTARLGLLSAKVKEVAGIPILNAEQIAHGGIVKSCKETTALERLTDLIKKIDWKTIPQDAGKFIGWLAEEFAKGLGQR